MPPLRMTTVALLASVCMSACVEQTAPADNAGTVVDPPSSAFASAPADGNGNKIAVAFVDDFSDACPNGDVLDIHLEGWFQGRVFEQPQNPNVQLEVFHALITFTNANGETYQFHDIGPDHYYVQDGMLFLALSGHSAGSNVIGHVILNVSTGETVEFSAGKGFGSVLELACQALT